jgi:hypothetical protein
LLLRDFGLPLGEDLLHLLHPLRRCANKVVFDGAVAEGDEVVLLVVR